MLNPRLIALNGPAEGETFPLQGERFTLGRQADNDLVLPSLAVSRRHCELCRDADGGYSVVDLGSRHGVFVNSRPVRQCRLAHSDLLTVGGFVLLFLLDDSTAAPAAEAPAEAPFVAGSTLARRPTEILYLDRLRVEAALPAQARIARDLYTLLQVSTALQGPLSLAELGERLLAPVLEVVPAGHAAVLLAEPGAEELTALAERTRGGAAGFPTELLARVLGDKVGLLCEGSAAGGPLSLLAAPLLGRDGLVLGVIGCAGESDPFDERHLELLTAIAGIASPAFDNALHLERLERENRRLREHQLRHDLVGESVPIRRLLDLIARVARADTSVLIRGESGTGKELAAQALHRSSPRARGPFVAINCATLSETLLESELFGHEKGAFTGAIERKTGKIEAAQGGTLFLDEVGEIPRPLQAKLLRVLQEREFVRVGGTRPIRADVRVIAATNLDLEAAIREGSFREDLYYRLKVITLETPALRQRPEDIPLLASHFAALHGQRLGRRGVGISPEARRCLTAYPWPGNVRELGNVIERALVLGENDVILPEDLPDEVVEGAAPVAGELHAARLEHKKKLVLAAWREAGGDYAAAAVRLGVHVNSLHRMIRQLGLKGQLDR
jgi:DNA-binding NtrC family response regulator